MKDIKLQREIEEILKRNDKQPERINSMLGLKLVDCSRDEKYVEFQFDSMDWCLNPYNSVHGGIISSAIDTAMGIGALALSQQFISTSELTVSYLRAMTGSSFIVRAEYVHLGKRMIRCTAKVVDVKTRIVCVVALGCFIVTESRAKGMQI